MENLGQIAIKTVLKDVDIISVEKTTVIVLKVVRQILGEINVTNVFPTNTVLTAAKLVL